jgi:hypothetical protein
VSTLKARLAGFFFADGFLPNKTYDPVVSTTLILAMKRSSQTRLIAKYNRQLEFIADGFQALW